MRFFRLNDILDKFRRFESSYEKITTVVLKTGVDSTPEMLSKSIVNNELIPSKVYY